MKRCPQCEFIYEESQRHCDMDGTELVHAAKPLASLKRPTKHTSRLVKSQQRKLAVRGAAAIVLGAILFVAFYGFMHQSPPESLELSSARIAPLPSALLSTTSEREQALHSKIENQVVPKLAQASRSPSRSPHSPTTKLMATHNSSPTVKSPVRSRLPTPRREVRRCVATGAANHKSESKVGSFLRKTGRLLKKPFKR